MKLDVTIDFPAMSHSYNFDNSLFIVNEIKDAVWPHSEAVLFNAFKFFAAVRPRIVFQFQDCLSHPVKNILRQPIHLLFG